MTKIQITALALSAVLSASILSTTAQAVEGTDSSYGDGVVNVESSGLDANKDYGMITIRDNDGNVIGMGSGKTDENGNLSVDITTGSLTDGDYKVSIYDNDGKVVWKDGFTVGGTVEDDPVTPPVEDDPITPPFIPPVDEDYTPSTPSRETVTEKNEDGSTTTTVTDNKTGVVTKTTKFTDGTTTVVNINEWGETTAEVKLSSKAVENQSVVTLPITAAEQMNTVALELPDGVEELKVEVPVENLTPGTVIVMVHADGTEKIMQKSTMTENGVALNVTGDVTFKVVDNSQNFNDVASNFWGNDAVDFVSARGIMNGVGNNEFAPNDKMNRASLAVMLHNLESNPAASTSAGFGDVGQTWYTDAVNWAAENGIMNGVGNNSFGAMEEITREQFAVMLYRYAGSPATSGSTDGFTDAGEISNWAADAMRWAVEMGIMGGNGSGLNPTGSATRAEVATMLMRYMNQYM